MGNRFAEVLLRDGALSIRDIAAGEEPFLYSSGMKGPGYANVKGQVSNRSALTKLVFALAGEVVRKAPHVEFVAANATGGMVPGWILAEALTSMLSREIPYVYIRGTRKKGGHKELITGMDANPMIREGCNGLVVEELVNFAETTCNSAGILREVGFQVTNAACILDYNRQAGGEKLRVNRVELIHLLTLEDLLEEAEQGRHFEPRLVTDYREFLAGPQAWMDRHGFAKDEQGGTM